MCANSPKDYTKATIKLQIGKDLHGRGRDLPQNDRK